MDYSGHVPDEHQKPFLRALPPLKPDTFRLNDSNVPKGSSPIKELLDRMVEDTEENREKILIYLIENPGMLSTFGNDFYVELAPLELRTLNTPPDTNPLDEIHLEITQRWRIRRRKDDDDDRTSLGGNPGGEARSD